MHLEDSLLRVPMRFAEQFLIVDCVHYHTEVRTSCSSIVDSQSLFVVRSPGAPRHRSWQTWSLVLFLTTKQPRFHFREWHSNGPYTIWPDISYHSVNRSTTQQLLKFASLSQFRRGLSRSILHWWTWKNTKWRLWWNCVASFRAPHYLWIIIPIETNRSVEFGRVQIHSLCLQVLLSESQSSNTASVDAIVLLVWTATGFQEWSHTVYAYI